MADPVRAVRQLVWSELVASGRARASRRRLRQYLEAVGRDGDRADRAYQRAVRLMLDTVAPTN